MCEYDHAKGRAIGENGLDDSGTVGLGTCYEYFGRVTGIAFNENTLNDSGAVGLDTCHGYFGLFGPYDHAKGCTVDENALNESSDEHPNVL